MKIVDFQLELLSNSKLLRKLSCEYKNPRPTKVPGVKALRYADVHRNILEGAIIICNARRLWWGALEVLQTLLEGENRGTGGVWLAAPLPALYAPELLQRFQGWVWAPEALDALNAAERELGRNGPDGKNDDHGLPAYTGRYDLGQMGPMHVLQDSLTSGMCACSCDGVHFPLIMPALIVQLAAKIGRLLNASGSSSRRRSERC